MSLVEKSFSLIRTNPKLTGNVKLVIDTNQNLYLESFSINKILKKEQYKHFTVKYDEFYKEVIPVFFSGVENTGIFETKRDNDVSEVYDKFRFQFDDTYFAGAQFVEDNWYNQEFEYHAPLYLKRDSVPTDFIILRVDGPGSLTEQSDKENFRSQIINNWKFVTSFDMTDKSKFGKWFDKNFISDETLPIYPLEILHRDIDLSKISGLDTKYGGWVTKYENLTEFQSKNTPIFKCEEYITKLFETKELIYPDIINLKFLFDDTPATPTTLRKYSINRYLGFYIDEKEILKSVYSYSGYELNKVSLDKLEELDYIETSQIPYLKNNVFVQEINGRFYSFDPIKNGWNDDQTYWVEFNEVFYRLEKVVNVVEDPFALDVIIGDFLYRIVSDTKIEHTVDNTITDIDLINNTKKILINELSQGRNQIKITNNIIFNNFTAKNLIESVNPTFTTLVRNFETVDVNGVSRTLFRISLESSDNTFKIDNFNEADLHLMNIENNHYVIKQYPLTTPNVGGKYYLHTDYAIKVDNIKIERWINDGINTQDVEFWQRRNIENVPIDQEVPFYTILRVNFTDVKDFDFERLETDYSKYEYEKELELNKNIEPKLYAKEYRESVLKINTLENDYARRIPILDINNRPLNIRDQNGEINPFTNEAYTAEELYFRDENGNWVLFEGELDGQTWSGYNEDNVNLARQFYREENYIFRIEDENEILIAEIDFRPTSDSKTIYEELTFGVNGKNEISDQKIELPDIISRDPNEEVDTNYIPVTSEYITSDELWEIKNNDLTSIWDKNQSICKWSFLNSNGLHDYPYRLTYSLDIGGERNREPNRDTNREYPERNELNLDYFYRFGIENPAQYQHYNLHLNEAYFDIDKYYSNEFDYFEYLFKSDQQTQDGLKLTRKYSIFEIGNGFNDAFTLFKGVKYLLTDVTDIIIDEEELNDSGTLLIDDVITQPNNKYKNYKFAIVFGRKLSTFDNNPGDGNSNLGFDIYLNDYWKNCVVHIHINTDEVLQITDSNGEFVNAETTPIDIWYEDNLDREDINPIKWSESEFKINNFGINLRPRDVMLWEFINILENYNYDPAEQPKNVINFIHIYDDNSSKIMDYTNTDFSLLTEQPQEFLIKEKSFITKPIDSKNLPTFDISNTLENRIIIDDDPNNINGDPEFTIDGLKVDSINDLNSYNNYPIAKTITENQVDRRLNWELDDETDPSLFRYDGPYIPIFKEINLFRPLGYNTLKNSTNSTPILKNGNWKFYDPDSDDNLPNVIGFGLIDELLFSKVNRTSNPLKINDPDNKERSIYPMVDEYGYDFDARYIFSSNWEPTFHYESKLIEVPQNDVSNIAGFTIHYDGIKEFIRIPDQEKFNLQRFLVDNVNFENYILTQPTIGEKNGFTQQIEFSDTENNEIRFKLLANKTYQLRFDWISVAGSATNAKYQIEIENDPENNLQSGVKYIHSSEVSSFASAWENNTTKFVTNRYSQNLANSKTSYPTTPPSILPVDYIDNYLINVKITFSTDSSDLTIANLTFNMIGDTLNQNNFLLIDIGEKENVNGFQNLEENITQSWSAFFKKSNESGNILNYSKKITNWSYVDNIDNDKNLLYEDKTIKSSTNSAIYEVRNGFRTHIPTTNVFNQKDETPPLNTPSLDTSTITLSQSELEETPLSTYSRFVSIPNDANCLYQQLAPQNFTTFMDYKNSLTPIIRISNNTPFEFEPDRQTYIADGKSIFLSQEKNGILTQPYIVLQWFKTYRDGFIEFDIIPENGNTINIKSRIRQLSTNTKLTSTEVINELNNNLINTIYFAQLITTPTSSSHFEKIIIKTGGDDSSITNTTPLNPNNVTPAQANSPLLGSYYNFNVNIKTTNDLKISSGPINSTSETSISSRYNKTTLKDGLKRIDNFVNEITIEFWVKIDGWVKEYETILYKGSDVGGDAWDNTFNDFTYIIGKFNKTDKLAFKTSHLKLDGSKITHTIASELEINDGEWHHIAFTTNLLNRTKSIYIDGELDVLEEDYLELRDGNGDIIDDDPSEREMVAQFLDNRNRFLPGDIHNSMGPDYTLANKIRISSQDSHTLYWYDVIRGLRDIDKFDAEWQQLNWGATVVDGYEKFEENYKSLDYYLNIDPDAETGGELNWDILLGTDSSVNNGRRNFEGFIDELRIWNYARTEEQIINNYRYILRPESQLDPLNSLVAYYRFDEGQGVNNISDLMNGKLIKDITRWAKVTTTLIDDGKNEKEVDNITFYQFEKDFYTGSSIEIDDEETDWDLSGANIIGFSDERNVISAPDPILEENIRERQQPIFDRTKAMLRKRRKKRYIFNVKTRILDVSKTRTFEFKRTKWWLFKKVSTRVQERLKSSKIRFRIRRKGKEWLTNVKKLTNKRRK